MSVCLVLLLGGLNFTLLSQALQTRLPMAIARHSMALNSLGSDIMPRPEDENSPEFKEYLRNLMKMQANRAKTGFAAPSSGSSDAYVAKLNRLKIERQALRDAGLGDAEIDTSYKEEDYKAAMYESTCTIANPNPHPPPPSPKPNLTTPLRHLLLHLMSTPPLHDLTPWIISHRICRHVPQV